MVDQSKCPECGVRVQVERRGHMEITRCPNCGAERRATVIPVDEVNDIGGSEKVTVLLRWKTGRASAAEAAAIRKIVPALAARPLSEILATTAIESPTLELGVYNRSQAVDLVECASRIGLLVFLKPVVKRPSRL